MNKFKRYYATLLLAMMFAFIGGNYANAQSSDINLAKTVSTFSCDFENSVQNASWTLANGSQTNKWYIGAPDNAAGNNFLYISGNEGLTNSYDEDVASVVYAYTQLTIAQAGGYMVSFDWQLIGETDYDMLRAFLVPTSLDPQLEGGNDNGVGSDMVPSGWIDVANPQGQLAPFTNWHNNASYIELEAGSYYLVFSWENDASAGNQPPASVDNILIYRDIRCGIADVTVNVLSDEQATVSVTYENTSLSNRTTQYVLSQEQMSESQLDNAEKTVMTSQSVTFSGLSAGIKYYFYVQSSAFYDGTDCTSHWKCKAFVTSCDNLQMPLSEGFESENAQPLCWTIVYGDNDPNVNQIVRDGAKYSEGNYSLRFSSYSRSANYYQYLISPELSIDNNAVFSFDYSCETRDDYLYCGYSSTTSDVESFTWSEALNKIGSFADTSIVVPAGTKYIAIRYYGDYKYYAWVDNINVIEPSCDDVESITAEDVSCTTASISMSVDDGFSGNIQYVLSTSQLSDAELASASKIDSEEATISLAGLRQGTQYYLYARTAYRLYGELLCAGNWNNVSFSTQCGVFELPVAESFESGTLPPACWSIVYGESGVNEILLDENHTDGNYSIMFSSFDSSNDYNQYLISPQLYVTEDAVMSFDYKCYDAGDFLYYGYSTTTSNIEDFTWSNSINSFNAFSNAKFYVPAGTKYVAIRYFADYRYYAWVDNINIFVPTCSDIASMVVDEVTSTSASISLSYNEDAVGQIQYVASLRQLSTAELESAEKNISELDAISVTELKQGSQYYLYARTVFVVNGNAMCTGNWNQVSFATPCGEFSLPVHENFSSEIFPPACWTVAYGDNNPSVNTIIQYDDFASDGWYTFRFSANEESSDYNQYLISPQLPIDEDAILAFEYMVEVWESYVDVGFSSTTSDLGSFSWEEVVLNPEGMIEEIKVDVPAGTKYVALKYRGENHHYMYLDYVKIYVPSCDVDNINIVVNSNTSRASVKWTSSAAGSEWQVAFARHTSSPLSADELQERAFVVNSPGYTPHETIEQNVAYDVYVRSYDANDCQWQSISMASCPLVQNLHNVGKRKFVWDSSEEYEDWLVVYSQSPITDWNSVYPIEVNQMQYEIPANYVIGTDLYFYVRPNCESENIWWLFKESNGQVLYSCDFEDASENANWVLQNEDINKWSIGSAVNNGGSNSLYISNDNGVTNYYNCNRAAISNAYRLINVPESGIYLISFDWMAYGEVNYDYLSVYMVPESSTEQSDWNIIESQLLMSNIWQKYTSEKYLEAGSYYLLFKWVNDSSTEGQPPASIDNIQLIKYFTCAVPEDIFLSIAPTSVKIDMSEGNVETLLWETDIHDAVAEHINGTSKQYDNLIPEHEYNVGIYRNCGNGLYSELATYSVETQPCDGVTNLSAFSQTANSVSVRWDSGTGDVDLWQVAISQSSDENDIVNPEFRNNNAYFPTGLLPETTYYVYVRSYCSAEYQSSWSQVEFTTEPLCSNIDGLTVSSVESNSVGLEWYGNEDVSQWQVIVTTSNNPDAEIANAIMVSQTNTIVSGLQPETAYNAYVRSYCSADAQGHWQNVDFITSCAAVTLPLRESFESGDVPPRCWTLQSYGATLYNTEEYSTEGQSSLRFPPDFSCYGQSLISPEISTEKDMWLTFDVKFEEFGYNYLRCFYLDAFDNKEYCANVESYTDEWQHVSIMVPNNATHLEFLHVGDDGSVLLDNIVLEEVDCMPVKDIWFNYVGRYDVDLSWLLWSAETSQWQVLVSQSPNVEEATETPILTSSVELTVTGLTPETEYYVYVRTYCSEDQQSMWIAAPSSFLTQEACSSVEYIEHNFIGKTNFEVNWYDYYDIEEEDAYWDVYMSTTEMTAEELAAATLETVYSKTYQRNDLQTETTYYLYVRTHCNNGFVSEWNSTEITTQSICTPVEMYEINFVELGSTSFEVEWEDYRDLTDEESYWEVYFTDTEQNFYSLADITPETLHTKRYSRSGLQAGTMYYLYVRTYCTNGNYSDWSMKEIRTLEVDPMPMNYSQDFSDGVAENWVIQHSQQTGWYVGIPDDYDNNCLYISNDGGVTRNYGGDNETYSYAYCILRADGDGLANIKFLWSAMGEPTYDLLRAFLIPVSLYPDLTEGNSNGMSNYYNSEPYGWIDISDIGVLNQLWGGMSEQTVRVEAGYYYLAFFWKNDTSNDYPPAAMVDDIQVSYHEFSDGNDILSYWFDGVVNTTIDNENHTVVCDVVNSTNLSEVYPMIEISDYATISPESGDPVNLERPVRYNVYSELQNSQEWIVSANKLPKSADAEITSISFDGIMSYDIDSENASIIATTYSGRDLTSVPLYLEISQYATINHNQGRAYDFTYPRNFVVTAENGTRKIWTVSIVGEDIPLGAGCSNPITINASTDLPYVDNNDTEGKYNMFFDFQGLSANDIVYELVVPRRMMIKVEATSETPFSLTITNNCNLNNEYWPNPVESEYVNEIIFEPDTYYIIMDSYSGSFSYELHLTNMDYCFEVANVQVTSRMPNAISLEWRPGADETSWVVSYSTGEDAPTEINVDAPSCTITGLSPLTEYNINVASDCGNGNRSYWSDIVASTVSSCPNPDNLAIDALYSDEVVLSWEGYNMTQWLVEYKTAEASEYEEVTVVAPTVTLSNLATTTAYNVRVSTVCENNTYSEYETLNFFTPCESITVFPYTQTFDEVTFPPTCWSQERTAAGMGSGISYPNGAWRRSTATVGENSTPMAQLADTKVGSEHNLVTLPFEFAPSANGYNISFDLYRVGTSEESMYEGVEVLVSSTPSITDNSSYLGFVSKNYTQYFDGEQETPGWHTCTFNTNKTGNVFVILVGKSNYAGGLYIDNLVVAPNVSCPAPTYVVENNYDARSVSVAWNPRYDVDSWIAEYSLNGAEAQTVELDTSVLDISGLEPATFYEIALRVKSVCEAGVSESDWYVDTLRVMTECEVVQLPMTENFDAQELPNCWIGISEMYDEEVNGYWTVNNGAAYLPPQQKNVESRLISPLLNIDGSANYVVDFNVYRSRISVASPDILTVYLNDRMTENGATYIGSVNMQNAQVNGMENFVFEIPRIAPGAYYLIFKADGTRAFRLDDVTVREKHSEADILTFSFAEQLSDAVIDTASNTITVDVDFGTDLTSLVPTFTISPNAVVDHASGEARDFSETVAYNVVSEDGNTSKVWNVNVSIASGACPNPTANDISFAVYGDSVAVSIAHIYNETSYNVKISSEQIDPAEDTAYIYDASVDVAGDETSFVVVGINPHTQYYVYVQSECGRGWTSTSFASGCGIYEMPYIEDFSSAINVDCWTIDDANADGKTWTITNGAARYSYSRSRAANDYLTSPLISIAPNAKLMFDYYVSDFSYSEKFSVYVIAGEDTTQIQETMTVRNENVETFGPMDISEYAGQDVRISIKCESDPYMFKLNVTNIKIQPYDYIIDASSVGNGSISPDGLMDIVEGDSIAFDIVPMHGNELISLTLDGRDVSSEIEDSVYVLSDIRASHTLVATFTERYVVNAVAGENGTINPEGEQIVEAGESLAFVILPDDGYRISSLIVDSVDVAAGMGSNVYIMDSIQADHNIEVSFAPIVYHTIYAEAGEHGSVSPSDSVSVEEGTSKTFTIVPDDGYRVESFEIDGEEVQLVGNEYTFENVVDDHTLNVTFEEAITYTITASCGENGTITPTGEVLVDSRRNSTFTIVPNDGYHISSVLVDGVERISGLVDGTYTFHNVTDNHTIRAEFAINMYTISTYVSGGTITPNGSVSVAHGSSQTFEFAPNEEYELLNVFVDNQIINMESNSYTFDSVVENHAIVVVFTPMNIVRYTIEASATEHGTISPSGNVRVVEGENQQFVITPDEHCYVSSLLVDGEPKEISGTYTFENVTGNHTIAATFETYKHTVTVTVGAHGSVNPSGTVLVDEGTDKTFTFEPYLGYRVSEVLLDGNAVEFANNAYTLENVMEDHELSVSFEMTRICRIEAHSSDNGTISPNGVQYVSEGSDVEYVFTPDDGYMLEYVLVDGQIRQTNGVSYTFENVVGDHNIYASFKLMVYEITAIAGEHGTISPSGTVEVRVGLNQRFDFVPDMGYEVDSVFVDGESVAFSNNRYLFENVDSSHTIEVTFRHITVSIDDVVAEETSLYPNPNNGAFMVDFAGMNGLVTYQLVDVRGAMIDSREVYVEDGYTMEFVYDLKPGTYFVRFVMDDKVIVKQFVVK